MKYLIIFLLLIPNVLALNITADYPEEIEKDSEFEINIKSNSSKTFDIKIDIQNKDKRISRILSDNDWKSTMYYIQSGFSKENEYKIKTEDYIGHAKMIIKLRENDDIYEFGPYDIKISDKVIEKSKEQEKAPKEEREEKIKNFTKRKEKKTAPKTIELNPKTIKKEKDNVSLGQGLIKYSLAIFCFILFVLYVQKPKEKKNEFR